MRDKDTEEKNIISADQVSIHYEISRIRAGHHFLVFLHGLGGDLTAWDNERLLLKQMGYSTLAIDLRGHGLSDHPKEEERYSFDYFAKDILEIIAKEKIEEYVVVGHCLGGMIGMTLEGLYPKSAAALILVDASYRPILLAQYKVSQTLLKRLIGFGLRSGFNQHIEGYKTYAQDGSLADWDVVRIIKDILYTSPQSYFSVFDDFVSADLNTLLKQIVIPTCVIEGSDDTIVKPVIAEELHKKIAGSTLFEIRNANHILVINNPVELAVTIEKFLRKIHY